MEMASRSVRLVGKQDSTITLQCGLDIRTEYKTGEISPSNLQLRFMPFSLQPLSIITFQN